MINSQREEHADRVETNDWGECLGIVGVICLSKYMSNQTSLVRGNGTIKITFDGEDPFACDDVDIFQMGNQGPSPSRNQGLHLIIHHRFAFTYLYYLNMRSWNRLGGHQKGKGTKGWRKTIIGNKVRNGMVSTSVFTLAKGDGKVKIIWRGLGNDDQGWRGDGGVGG